MSDGRQRIDKWLVYARLAKTRSAAAELVERGRIRVNRERTTKIDHPVEKDVVLTLSLPHTVRIIKILRIGARRGPASEARLMYEDLTPGAVQD